MRSLITFCGVIAVVRAEVVSIYKIGFPETGLCGQEANVTKSNLNPHYFFPMNFGGFKEGLCADAGYSLYQETRVVDMHPVPGVHHNLTFQLYAKPTLLADRDPGCKVGGASLCSCSELLRRKLIQSVDDCTQEAAAQACATGKCRNDDSDMMV
eukprot:TRINITY_DN10462_c0_g1_i1.p1 TRINITY_DN10462_c0_g1~~TRINITY_DN10462_c0_g1_i1.p1  ORF type:complete len:154 (-),score=31.72 TRINITY_DN10462_c0_g1_i1:64-525(-)